MKDFKNILEQEKNETTALILMLSVLSQKLSDIAELLKGLNKLSSDLLSCQQCPKESEKQSKIYYMCLTPEDYD